MRKKYSEIVPNDDEITSGSPPSPAAAPSPRSSSYRLRLVASEGSSQCAASASVAHSRVSPARLSRAFESR